jgi:hypothetical protein
MISRSTLKKWVGTSKKKRERSGDLFLFLCFLLAHLAGPNKVIPTKASTPGFPRSVRFLF